MCVMSNKGVLKSVSRREFIKLGGMGISAAITLSAPNIRNIYNFPNDWKYKLSNIHQAVDLKHTNEVLSQNQQGRVLTASVDVYDAPTFSGKLVNSYWRDWVLPISDITIGTVKDSFNLVWYKVGDEGYTHSGAIQPVLTLPNSIVEEIPPDGVLSEVTVPFTDARWDPGDDKPVAYRFYYATTYWITEFIRDDKGNPWYGILDDKWEYMFYVPATHLRVIPPEEMNSVSSDVPSNMKRIEVHLPEQVMIAYEFDQAVFMARVATGAIFSNGDFSTPAGRYMTFHKRSSRHMARGNLAANGYDLPGVPWNSYITEEGIAFHGTYWHNNFGRPRSHGCINLTPQAAKWVFLWTMPSVPPDKVGIYKDLGTTVDIFT